MGFYTGRQVEASSPEEAEQAALAMLRSEYQFNETQRTKAPDARVYFEELFEVEPETEQGPNKGACWFDMDDVEQRDKSESECKR